MIAFFRRALSSKLVLGLFALIMIAFVVTGIGTPGGLGDLAGGGGRIAKVGGRSLDAAEIENRIRREYQIAAQQQPGLDMASFIRLGGADRALEQTIAGTAMELFARKHGMTASKKLVDGQIAGIGAFRGPNGKFDQATFRQVLAAQQIGEAQLRAELAGDAIRQMVLVPLAAAARAPAQLVAPYASLLLERREGKVGLVPTALVAGGPAPTDAELQAHYRTNIAAYTIPERRVLRYALFGRDNVAARAAPSEADIAAFYRANQAQYAARAARSFSQVILDSEAKARDFAAKVRAGTPFAAAAQAAGFAPATTRIGAKTQAEMADFASPAVAAAAFAAPEGGISAPAKSDFGWHVVHVDAVVTTAGKTLAQARPEIAASLARQRQDEALADLAGRIEDAISGGASFAEVVAENKLQAVTTPALLANGAAPDQPGYRGDPALPLLLKPAFEANPDDDATVETIGKGERYAVLSVAQVVPAAPIPLAKIRERVAADVVAARAAKRAKTVADAIAAKVNAGTPIEKAFAEAGMKLPAVQTARATRIELARLGDRVPPPLALMFSMARPAARTLPAGNGEGWFVVKLDRIEAGDAGRVPGLVDATRSQFARVLGDEYAEQFAQAAREAVGVSINARAFAELKARLAGGAGAQ